MIFVTLGSQKFQFDRLLKKIDELIEQGAISDEVIAQTGASTYIPKHYTYMAFMNQDEFAEKTNQCDLFITHGGTGAIIGAVKKGKKVIAVPRLAKYGEHIDDHQLQVLKKFEDMGQIVVCYDLENLADALRQVQTVSVKSYHSNTETIIADIEEFLEEVKRGTG